MNLNTVIKGYLGKLCNKGFNKLPSKSLDMTFGGQFIT